ESIRDYAREKLEESDEANRMYGCHRRYFLDLAHTAEQHYGIGDAAEWLERLETEHDNLRVALDRVETPADRAEMLQLATALCRFWLVRGYWQEGCQWLSRALDLHTENDIERARALNGFGNLACQLGDYAAATRYYMESLSIRRQLEDQRGIASCLNNLGLIENYKANYSAARPLLEEALQLFRDLGLQRHAATTLSNLGVIALMEQRHDDAYSLLNQSYAILTELEDRLGQAETLTQLGRVAFRKSDLDQAHHLLAESAQQFRQIGEKLGVAEALLSLGDTVAAQGRAAEAKPFYEESRKLATELGATRLIRELSARCA
ncbi:MAG: tetratricopeptide repeat protein, partial [Acidobacteria bacterium]|nr:tetratricopeptide repeat protein [Acidobacteriota bacterium]